MNNNIPVWAIMLGPLGTSNGIILGMIKITGLLFLNNTDNVIFMDMKMGNLWNLSWDSIYDILLDSHFE